MTASLLGDAFAHHIWASERLIDECAALTPEQLKTPAPGTYGSIIDTLRHLVASGTWYLSFFPGEHTAVDEEVEVSLAEITVGDDEQLARPGWSSSPAISTPTRTWWSSTMAGRSTPRWESASRRSFCGRLLEAVVIVVGAISLRRGDCRSSPSDRVVSS